jgi:enoyl-CoA hydratase
VPIRTEAVLPEDKWQFALESEPWGIAALTNSRPEKPNPWSWGAAQQPGVLPDRIRFNDDIRVLLVRGEGRPFCELDLGMPEDRVSGRTPVEKVR